MFLTKARTPALCLGLTLVVLAAYANHFQNIFHFDDSHTIVENRFVRDLHNVPGFFTDATRFSVNPAGLTARESMAIGTAGFTAAMSVAALEERGLTPTDGPVLVTGATGGVGSTAVAILAERGYEVWAATGKEHEEGYLRGLGYAKAVNLAGGIDLWARAVDPSMRRY